MRTSEFSALKLKENRKLEQFFFADSTAETLACLASAHENIACLCTPSVSFKLQKLNRDHWLLELDNRILQRVDSPKVIRYDIGQHHSLQQIPANIKTQIASNIGCIVVDPPFGSVPIEDVLQTINYLFDYKPESRIYMTHQKSRYPLLANSSQHWGLEVKLREDITVDYLCPSNKHQIGKNPIGLYEFKVGLASYIF